MTYDAVNRLATIQGSTLKKLTYTYDAISQRKTWWRRTRGPRARIFRRGIHGTLRRDATHRSIAARFIHCGGNASLTDVSGLGCDNHAHRIAQSPLSPKMIHHV
jgi:hypothetical protein